MTACAWCLRFTAGSAEWCQFPGSDQAYAVNAMRAHAAERETK